MNEELFTMLNHHVPSCGEPPKLPGRQPGDYLGYFENKFGEQWLFLANSMKQTIEVRGGDCGWDRVMTPIRVSVSSYLRENTERKKSRSVASLHGQIGLAGVTFVPKLVLSPSPKTKKEATEQVVMTFLVDVDGCVVMNEGEHIWLDACIAACGVTVPTMTLAQWTELMDKTWARIDADEEDEDEEDEDDKE